MSVFVYSVINHNKVKIMDTKIKFPFYSIEDIKFRLVRDLFLKKTDYEKTMFLLINEKKFEPKKFYSNLFFNKEDLINLNKLGHLIGLHSHNHPTQLEALSYEQQKQQYKKNISTISKIINKPQKEIKWMSHPCGSYDNNTLQILKEIGIELGFKQIMTIEAEKGMKTINNSFLEIARNDHVKILKMMS